MVQFFAKSGYSSLVEWDKKWKINKSSRSQWRAHWLPTLSPNCSTNKPLCGHVSGNVFWQKEWEKHDEEWEWFNKLVTSPTALHIKTYNVHIILYVHSITYQRELFACLHPIQKSILYSNIAWILQFYQLSHKIYNVLGGCISWRMTRSVLLTVE